MGRRGSSKRRRVETPVSLSNTQVSLSSLVSDFSVCKVGISSWTDLPLDIVNLILDKLTETEVVEYIRFGSVCKEWYIIFKQYVKPSRNVIPMLFAPSPDPDALLLYCLTKRYSNLRLRLPYSRRRYIGTSHGWIAIQNWDFTFTLVYPFGKEIHKIPLPPLSWNSTSNVKKLIISSDSTISDYTVVAIYYNPNEFSTIKTGEKSWVCIDVGSRTTGSWFTDIIFHRGAVYGIDHLSNIIEVDVHARPPVIKAVHHLLLRLHKMKYMQYLVESTSSDLYLLQRFYHRHDRSRTTRFNIFKLKVHGEKGEQFITRPTKSKVPEGDTFFIGDVTTSMAIKSTGCIHNSVYFIDKNYCLPYPKCRYIVASYSTGDGNIRNIYKTNIGYREGVCQPPIWIVPRLHFDQSEKLLPF